MTRHRFELFLSISLIALLHRTDFGNAISADANVPFRIELTSASLYTNPVTGVDVICQFYHNDSLKYTCNGYWDGGTRYCVKFSLPDTGMWQYIVFSSDSTNSGLHNIAGKITIRKNNSTNSIYSKGFIKPSSDRRYLTYSDGSPFFYLGDTAWEITWKSRAPEVLAFIEDRKRKKFSALQIVAMTHQDFNFARFGVMNRQGEPYYLNNDYSLPNPRYFDYLDSIVTLANSSGLIVSLVPLWAAMMNLYTPAYNYNQLTVEESLLIAKYLAARYAAYNLIWIIGGDNAYDTNERKSFWSDFAHMIKRASGSRQLCTCHPMGSRGSFDFFSNSTDWLDFNMYQSSHIASGDYTWQLGQRGFNDTPTKPVLNGEACYEDIYNNLWAPGDTSGVSSVRIMDIDVRQASYESVFAGSLVGITYGANGIWQWNTDEIPGTHYPRYTAIEALDLPASSQMTVLKDILLKYSWYMLKPTPALLIDFKSSDNHCQIAASDSVILVYIPAGTTRISLASIPLTDSLFCSWINPRDGTVILTKTLSTLTNLPIPNIDNDYVFVAQKQRAKTLDAIGSSFQLYQNFPNPFNSGAIIKYTVPKPSHVRITVYNMLGEQLQTLVDENKPTGDFQVDFKIRGHSGIYFYKLEGSNNSIMKKCVLLK